MTAAARRLEGCRALVTGGLGGIGMAIADAFAREGALVWIADVDEAQGDRASAALSRIEGARYLRLDVSCREHWDAARDAIGDSLDVLVNGAGIAPTGLIEDIGEACWQQVMAVNSTGAFLGLASLAPLLERGAKANGRWASVINISSILANVGIAQGSAYAASKGALRSFSRSAAVEFAQAGRRIRVNSLHPGFALTEMTLAGNAAMSDDGGLLDALAAQTPMGRIADPREIASAALFLASDESSFVTGSELTVDGGWTAV